MSPKKNKKSRSTKRQRTQKDRSSQSKRYQHPVPNESGLLDLLQKYARPARLNDLAKLLGVKAVSPRKTLRKRLDQMAQNGLILKNRNDEYCLLKKLNLVTGLVSAHRDGFGFLVADGEHDDVYLSAREMRAVFDGDRVAVRVKAPDRRGRFEGRIVEVLERGLKEVAGQYVKERGVGWLVPDNPKVTHRVLIPGGRHGGARHGEMAVARLIDYPGDGIQASGEIIDVLGHPGDRGMSTELAIHAHGIPNQWPAGALAEAEQHGSRVKTQAKKNRTDLRELALVTIDGADARDFDDAVYCERRRDGFRLLVAIADVAHYVEKEGALDQEALHRGTSVYFPDRVVPMLPEALSNGLCSLNPKVDRLALVCEIHFGPRGKVVRSKFFNAVIRSQHRLTYSAVAEYLRDPTLRHGMSDRVRDNVDQLLALYRVLAQGRRRRGALELDIPQLRIAMGKNGKVEGMRAYERNDAHRLIEECMIAANVEAAKFITRHRIPGLYRVHARPKQKRYEEFREYLLTLGFKVPLADDVQPKDFEKLLAAVRERPDAHAISLALLRSMAHAEYTPDNIGHFGLALQQYAHFTSPIRRYPDLVIHRVIKHMIEGGKPGKAPYSKSAAESLGRSTSATERRAEEATREVEAWLKCEYLQDKLGQQFQGRVTSVTEFGLFVLLDDLQVEGLVHVSSLRNDYYEYEGANMRLVGSRSGRQYQLGDTLDVVVHKVDMETRRIDFRLANARR